MKRRGSEGFALWYIFRYESTWVDKSEAGRTMKALFRDEEHAKTSIAVGGTLVAAIGFLLVLVAVLLFGPSS